MMQLLTYMLAVKTDSTTTLRFRFATNFLYRTTGDVARNFCSKGLFPFKLIVDK